MVKEKFRITVEALKYYVPLYQEGYRAEERLLEEHASLTQSERNHLETAMKLKELSAKKIAELSGPLITKEINKIIAGSHLRTRDDLFDLLYYAGLDGMRRGLRRFEVDKLNKSSTNYLFQWIVTYAKKELLTLEAPFGIPPSRFQKYKKISAVRKRLGEELKRYATNEEVHHYFQSGRADIANMNGRVANKSKPSQANLSITLELVEEQERFEKDMLNVELLDPLGNYSSDVTLSELDQPIFAETIFGAFCDSVSVTQEARAVIMSELYSNDLKEADIKALQDLSPSEFRKLLSQWKNLIKDVKGPFYKFLKDNVDADSPRFDVQSTIDNIENYGKVVASDNYAILFTQSENEVSS